MEQDKQSSWQSSSTSQGSSPSSNSSGSSDCGKDFNYYAQLEENINARRFYEKIEGSRPVKEI